MADDKEQLAQEGFTNKEVEAILQRATELQSRHRGFLNREELTAGAEAAGIGREFIDQALSQLKTEWAREGAQRRAHRKYVRIAAIAAAGLLVLAALLSYRALNRRMSDVEERWARTENVIQRRHNLIPNLIAMAKATAIHEKELITSLSQLNAELGKTRDLQDRQNLESKLEASTNRLMSALRANPAASSSAMFLRLSDEMAGAENRIAVERKRYNQAVAAYNRTARSFPISLMRPLLGFASSLPYFQTSQEAKKAPSF